jgi:hypothetical protein
MNSKVLDDEFNADEEARSSTPPPDGPTPKRSLLHRMSSSFNRSSSTSPFPRPSPTPPAPVHAPAPPSLGGLPTRIPPTHDHIPVTMTTNQSSISSLASSNTLASAASGSGMGSITGRLSPRISREDIQIRLKKQRSMDSPLREMTSDELFSPVKQVKLDQYDSHHNHIDSHNHVNHVKHETMELRTTVDFHSEIVSVVTTDSTAEDAQHAVLATAQRQTLGMRSALDRLVSDVASDTTDLSEPATTTRTARTTLRQSAHDEFSDAETDEQEHDKSQSESGSESRSESENDDDDEEDSMEVDEYVSASENNDVFGAVSHPPPPQPKPQAPEVKKDARIRREEEILRRRRTARRRDEDELMGRATPPRDMRPPNSSPVRRPIASGIGHGRTQSEGAPGMLDAMSGMEFGLVSGIDDHERSRLADSIARELKKKEPGKNVGVFGS